MPKVTVRIGKKLLTELDGLADDTEVTRGEIIRSLLGVGLDAFYEGVADEEEEEDEDEDEEDEEAEMAADEKEEAKKD